MNSLPRGAVEKLGHYVYLYVDPRDNAIFYVGKGYGGRMFKRLSENAETEMCKRVRAIRKAGWEPRIEILVHGLPDAETALRVEAAAIDLLDIRKLTNKVRGHDSATFGRMSIDELLAYYDDQQVEIYWEHQVMLIRINQLYFHEMSGDELYDATRGIWRVNRERAANVQYVLAVYDGIVREVYSAASWLPAGSTEYFSRKFDFDPKEAKDLSEFVGRIAPPEVRDKYLLKSVQHLFTPGSSNAFQYINC